MRKMILCTVAAVMLLASGAAAKDRYQAFTWHVSLPLEETSEYIDEISYLGFGFDTRKFTSRDGNWAWGISLNWDIMDQKTDETIVLPGRAITGNQRRYLNSFPLLVTGHLYLGSKRHSQIFVGAGAGAYYILQTLDIGVWRVEESNWHFGVAPEVGLRFPFGKTVDLYISGKYNYALASGENAAGEEVAVQYATLCVGLGGYTW